MAPTLFVPSYKQTLSSGLPTLHTPWGSGAPLPGKVCCLLDTYHNTLFLRFCFCMDRFFLRFFFFFSGFFWGLIVFWIWRCPSPSAEGHITIYCT